MNAFILLCALLTRGHSGKGSRPNRLTCCVRRAAHGLSRAHAGQKVPPHRPPVLVDPSPANERDHEYLASRRRLHHGAGRLPHATNRRVPRSPHTVKES